MSQTIAHRHGTHLHIPLTPVIAFAVAVIIAAAALVLINQPTFTSTTTETSVGAATAVLPAALPMPETPALRRHIMEQYAEATSLTPAEWRINHNRMGGPTLYESGGSVSSLPAPAEPQAGQFPGQR